MSEQKDDNGMAGDLLYGAPRIAAFLGIGDQAVYHLIRKGHIPSFKIGKTVCARKSRINAALDELERAGTPAAKDGKP